jgi:hypothetical protein
MFHFNVNANAFTPVRCDPPKDELCSGLDIELPSLGESVSPPSVANQRRRSWYLALHSHAAYLSSIRRRDC